MTGETFREKAVVTTRDILDGLRELGVREGNILFVHSALSAFGHVVDGADAVIDALLAAVGPTGNVVMPTFSSNRVDVDKTDRDTEMGISFKFKVLPYNKQTDGCWTGKIADTFWRRAGAVRGDDPAYSLTAIGPRAAELCRNLEQFAAIPCTIVCMGVGLGVCSALRLARERVTLPSDLMERITPPAWLKEEYAAQNIIFGFGPYPDYAVLEPACRAAGILRETPIGDAPVMAIALEALLECFAGKLREDPWQFYQRKWISPRYEHRQKSS